MNTFEDDPFEPVPFFLNSLFEEERKNVLACYSAIFPNSYSNANGNISSLYFPQSSTISSGWCVETPLLQAKALLGGDLSKPQGTAAQSSLECCELCLSNLNCIAWTFSQSRSCRLKSQPSSAIVDDEEAVSSSLLSIRAPKPRLLVFHGTTCVYENETISRRDPNTIWVGRFMLERSEFRRGLQLEEYAVLYCANMMDEVWVPSLWHKKVFENLMPAGASPPVHVIHESVDTALFNRDLAQSRNVMMLRQKLAGRVGYLNPFVFFSSFKWERRKGWDILLRNFWSEFSVSDGVVLLLQTYVPATEIGTRSIRRRLEDFAQAEFGCKLSGLPPVVLVEELTETENKLLSRRDARDIMASVHAFVLPTRGEGWGLPIAEAMAMEVPVIVTNYSGPTEFCDDGNAFLIPVEDYLDDLGFCIPRESVFRKLLRDVVDDVRTNNSREVLRRTFAARARMQELSPHHTVNSIATRAHALLRQRGWDYNNS